MPRTGAKKQASSTKARGSKPAASKDQVPVKRKSSLQTKKGDSVKKAGPTRHKDEEERRKLDQSMDKMMTAKTKSTDQQKRKENKPLTEKSMDATLKSLQSLLQG